ncbi:hypothetical protein Tco_1270720 [Tanacetum coccineum]
MIPPGIVRKHEDYINRMSLLCSNSSSQSSKNSHTNIESLPTSTTLIKNSDPNREEIDIFSGPDDSIPPGIESDFNSKEDIIDNLLNENPTHERLTFNIEPNALVINNVDKLNEDECFDPGGGENNVEVDDSFTIVIRTFLPFLTYLEVSPLLSSARNEDTILTPAFPLKAGGFSSGWNFRTDKAKTQKRVKTGQTRDTRTVKYIKSMQKRKEAIKSTHSKRMANKSQGH